MRGWKFDRIGGRLLAVLILVLLANVAAMAQQGPQSILLVGVGGGPGAAPATPGFVSGFATMPVNVAANPAGQAACTPDDSICPHYSSALLSGNLALTALFYSNATSLTLSESDEKSNTYTCANGSQTGTVWGGGCYALNAASGAVNPKVLFSAAANDVSAWPFSFYNVDLTTAPNVASCSGTSSTTANCASVTSHATNDLIVECIQRVGTPAVTSFTPGSGYSPMRQDITTGTACVWGAASGAGSVTPSITMASASTYTEYVWSFKSANAGTQPTTTLFPRGWVEWAASENITSGTTLAMQIPTGSANTIVMEVPCGGGLVPSAVSDGTAAWQFGSGLQSPWSRVLYLPASQIANRAANGVVTITFTGTGDCTVKAIGVDGAPATQIFSHAAYYQTNGAANANVQLWSDTGGTLGSQQDVMNVLATPSAGLIFFDSSIALNTINAIGAPASGCVNLAITWAGEAVDGPTVGLPGDENNGFGWCDVSTLTSSILQFNVANTSESGTGQSAWSDELGLFTTGAYAIMNNAEGRRTTAGTSLVLTVPSTTSGYTAVVDTAQYNGTNISSVAFTNGTGGTSAFTKCTSCATTSGTNRTSVWVNANEPAGATSVTITASASSSQLDGAFLELNGLSTEDAGGTVNAGTGKSSTACSGSGTFDCGASVTTAGTIDFVNSSFNSTNTITGCPTSGNEFTWYEVIWNNGGDGGACGLITQTAAAHRPIATDAGSGATFGESTEAYKP